MERNEEFFETARERKTCAESYWEPIFREYDEDLRYFADEQWTPAQITSREEAGRPTLTFNQVKQPVLRQINQLRQNKPAIKVNPRDLGATEETADFYEGRIRNIEYSSQADTARMHAAKCAAIGGIGFYRVITDYIDDESDEQDLFVRRILDPRTVLFDPNSQEPDLSDAKWCFVTQTMPWEDYKAAYPDASMISWDSTETGAWATEKEITIAEYWQVQNVPDETTRDGYRKEVHFDLVNGVESLKQTTWLGDCIPIMAVLGDEVMSGGKRVLSGMIRSARGAQQLLNAYLSGEGEAIGLQNRVPYIGPVGSFKTDKNWRDAHLNNPAYLQWDAVYGQNGELLPPPQRQQADAAIAAFSQASLQMTDAIKRAMGYSDDVINPSQNDLSGVAISRRSMQQEAANFHISDSLALAMWKEGNIYLDVLPKIHDTPRAVQITNEAGDVSTEYVTQMDESGMAPPVPGAEGKPHHILNAGRYQVTITVGPSYSTRIEEESDFLTQLLTSDPALLPGFLDVIFKLRGYPELEDRAKLLAPPAVQQAASGQQPLPPQAQAAMAENQQLKAQLQQMAFEQAADKYKVDAKYDSDRTANMVKLMVAEITSKSKEDIALLTAQMEAIAKKLDMLHESELAPGPDAGPLGIHPSVPPQPQIAGAPGQGPQNI